MKSVIVEGIDCSGKSSLIKALKYKLKKYGGYDVKELEHKDISNQFSRYALEYLSVSHTLFDRSHISEIVFGSILRNTIPFSSFQIKILNEIVSSEFVTVLATPSYDDFISRYQETRKYQVISVTDFNKINDKFIESCAYVNSIVYRSSSFNELEEVSNDIVNLLTNGELNNDRISANP